MLYLMSKPCLVSPDSGLQQNGLSFDTPILHLFNPTANPETNFTFLWSVAVFLLKGHFFNTWFVKQWPLSSDEDDVPCVETRIL